MAHSDTWNAAFEADPADGDAASGGAADIRQLKTAVQERLALDHIMDETDSDGLHKQITFDAPLGADPGDVTDQGMLYTKDVSSVVELFWKDESGNVVQITSAGSLSGGYPHTSNDQILLRPDASAGVATGWSTEAISNKAIRSNSVAVHSTADGGSIAFTTSLVNAHTTVIATEAGHTHTAGSLVADATAHGYNIDPGSTTPVVNGANHAHTISGTSSVGSAHTHTITLGVQYTDFRVVSKD